MIRDKPPLNRNRTTPLYLLGRVYFNSTSFLGRFSSRIPQWLFQLDFQLLHRGFLYQRSLYLWMTLALI